MADWKSAVSEHMGGGDKPKKEIEHIKTYKSANGDHIHEHHHKSPEHHPVEKHTTRGDDEMVQHMMANMGTANPGESAADPAAGAPQADPAAAPAGAAPVAPAGSGAAPTPMAAGA